MKNFRGMIGFLACFLVAGFGAETPLKAEGRKTSFYYLRCNSTSWDIRADGSNELRGEGSSDRVELLVNISDPHILQHSDDCAITRTSVAGTWGTDHQHLRVMQGQMEAPAASWVFTNQGFDEPHFRVRYPGPGRYRFQLFVRDSLLVITPEKGSGGGGTLSWALPGRVFQGAGGQLFRQSDGWNPDTGGSQSLLARVSPESGDDLWQYAVGDRYLAPVAECSQLESVVVTSDRDIIAFRRDNGEILWRNPINRETSVAYPILSVTCAKGAQTLYVSHGSIEEPKFSAVSALDGRTQWSRSGVQLLYSSHLNSQTLIVYRDLVSGPSGGASKRIFSAVEATTGRVLWSRSESPFTALYQDPEGRIYITGPDSWQRVMEAQGKTLWRFDTEGRWISPTFEQGGVFALNDRSLRRIDPSNGEVLWSYEGQTDAYLSVVYLPGHEILVREAQNVRLLEGLSGRVIWSREFPEAKDLLSVSQDKQGRVFVASSGWLRRIDPRTGLDLWHKQIFDGTGNSRERWFVQNVAESDTQKIYALVQGPGYRCPPMGLAALDAETGQLRWQRKHEGPIWISASDARQLYIAEGCQGPLMFQSIRK